MTLLPAGAPFIGLSGAAGNIVASHNRSGPYLRARTSPTGGPSSRQAQARQAFNFAVIRWQTIIADSDREKWAIYAAQVPLTNRIGRRTFLTGQQHYIRTNMLRFHNALTPVDACPQAFALVAWNPPFVELAPLDRLVRCLFGAEFWALTTGGGVTVRVTETLASTINFRAAPMRQCGIIRGHARPPPPYTQSFAWPWTTRPNPERAFYDLRLLNADGRTSTRFHGLALAAT